MTQVPAGWHVAPDRPGQMRYWDGSQWTGHYALIQGPPVTQPPVVAMSLPVAAQPTGLRCPHCGVVGRVKTKRIKQKQGISGGKATGAVLTAGFSVLATGLSRKQQVTECKCKACKMVWHVS